MLQLINMKSTEFEPMDEYALITPDPVETDETSSGGIILYHQKSVIMRPCAGTVVACGNKCDNIMAGDYVVFPDTDGIEVKFLDSTETKTFLLLRYASIIGVRKC